MKNTFSLLLSMFFLCLVVSFTTTNVFAQTVSNESRAESKVFSQSQLETWMRVDKAVPKEKIIQETLDAQKRREVKEPQSSSTAIQPKDEPVLIDTEHFKGMFQKLTVTNDHRTYVFDPTKAHIITDCCTLGGDNTAPGAVRIRIGWENDDQTIVNFYIYTFTDSDGWFVTDMMARLDNPNQPYTQYIEILGEPGVLYGQSWKKNAFRVSGPMNKLGAPHPLLSRGTITADFIHFKVGGELLVPKASIPNQKYYWLSQAMAASATDIMLTIDSVEYPTQPSAYPTQYTDRGASFRPGDSYAELALNYPGNYPDPIAPYIKFYARANYGNPFPWSLLELRTGDLREWVYSSKPQNWNWILMKNTDPLFGSKNTTTYFGDKTFYGHTHDRKFVVLSLKNLYLRYGTEYGPLYVEHKQYYE